MKRLNLIANKTLATHIPLVLNLKMIIHLLSKLVHSQEKDPYTFEIDKHGFVLTGSLSIFDTFSIQVTGGQSDTMSEY